MGDTGIDMITRRPRTARDQYTVLTDVQIKNIKKKPDTFFNNSSRDKDSNKRFIVDRGATSTSQHLFRGPNLSHPVCWIGDLYNRFPPRDHDTARLGASLRWGRNTTGNRTVGHYDNNVSREFLKIDMYKRPPTNQPGPVVMRFGRPGDGYYSQRNPVETTWFGATVPLNRTQVLQDIQPKTTAEYQDIRSYKQDHTARRTNKWPHYSEYTDKFTLSTKVKAMPTSLEKKKLYVMQAYKTQECEQC